MANSKNSRSNKTAHVLNLLTEPGEASKESSRSERPASAPTPTPPCSSLSLYPNPPRRLSQSLLQSRNLPKPPSLSPSPSRS